VYASDGCAWEVQWGTNGSWQQTPWSGACPNPAEPPRTVEGLCLPYVVTLSPHSAPALKVLGLDNGALEVQGTESVDETLYPFASTAMTCRASGPTTVSLSSAPPAVPVPSDDPAFPGPVPAPHGSFKGQPIPDQRVEQVAPSPLSGPLRQITGVLSSNDFSIPAFMPPGDPSQSSNCLLWPALDVFVAGWQDKLVTVSGVTGPKPAYNNACGPNSPPGHPVPCNPIAAYPGWAQSTGRTTITDIALPRTPPPGFGLG
jgi:hypothetical protein